MFSKILSAILDPFKSEPLVVGAALLTLVAGLDKLYVSHPPAEALTIGCFSLVLAFVARCFVSPADWLKARTTVDEAAKVVEQVATPQVADIVAQVAQAVDDTPVPPVPTAPSPAPMPEAPAPVVLVPPVLVVPVPDPAPIALAEVVAPPAA